MNKTELNRISNGEMVTISRVEYEKLQAQSKRVSELESRVDLLMGALHLARHKQFGASSEKSEDTLTEQLSFLFNEAEVFSAADKEAEKNVTVVAAHKRHKKHEYSLDNIPEGIPTEQAEHRLEGEEAVKSLPKGKAKGSSASRGLTYCNLLFGIEQEIADKTAEERYEERLKQAKPVLEAMLAWANSRTAAPKSALGKAFHYLKEQWPYLTNYLKDGRLEISNNRAERSIKPFVIDRKNFLFANTPEGSYRQRGYVQPDSDGH